MLIIYAILFIPALHTAFAAEDHPLPFSYARSKQGIINTDNEGQRDYEYHQSKPRSSRNNQNNNAKISYYKDKPGLRVYEGGFKVPAPYASTQIRDQSPPYFGNLFTISAGYKVGNEGPPVKQMTRNQNAGVHGPGSAANIKLPMYRIGYSMPKASESQPFSPVVQNQFNKKASSILQAHNDYPTYYNHHQSQPLVLSPADQFSYPERAPKLNNAHLSAPFLSPFSGFQSQVIPISIANSNLQFPQYKGAAVQVHPTVSGFSAIGYEPLQTQPQLHFGKVNAQATGGHHNLGTLQQIRTDVEIIDKKKPMTPPSKDDDDDESDDSEKDYRPGNNGDDDYEPKPDKQFTPSHMEGNFKPSTYFPFKQYDEKFGKYSKPNHEKEAEEKPYTNYSDYSSSNDDADDDDDDEDEDDSSSGKYHSEGISSKPHYGKHETEDDGNSYDYDRGKAEDNGYSSKYFEKNFDDNFGESYGRESPKQKYVKEESEDEYVPKSSYRNTDNHDSEDSTGQGSRYTFTHYSNPRGYKDNDGQGSNILTQVPYEGGYGYKLPENVRSFTNRMVTGN